MQYVYYCPNCNNLECYDTDNLNMDCSECGKKLIPLNVEMEVWNNLSNDEMISIIDKVKNKGLKKPEFKPTIDKASPEQGTAPQNKGNKKGNKLLPFLIATVVLLIIAVVFIVVNLTKGSKETNEVVAEEEEETAVPQETTEITKENLLDYFDIDIACGGTEVTNSDRIPLVGLSTYDLACDMTVTIKAKKPLQSDNCYISLDPHINKTYEDNATSFINDDKLNNIKLDSDGYYTNTQKIHMNDSLLSSSPFFYFPGNLEIVSASGTITYDEGLFDNTTQEETIEQTQ